MAEPQEEPQTALPRVFQEVRPHGTPFTGAYGALWVFLTYAALYADEWIPHDIPTSQLMLNR